MAKKKVDKSKMACNKPKRSTNPKKDRMVKACEGGKEKIIHYGDKSMKHNYSEKANDAFHARHNCKEKTSKLKAGYWACKDLWPKGKKKGKGAK